MRVSQAKELFRSLTATYFSGANVTLSRQSRVAKPGIPLVTITCGNVRRSVNSAHQMVDGIQIAHYPSRMSIQVDLFTHGLPVHDDETGEVVAYEDTAMDDMLAFVDFLDSQHTIEWCHNHDISVLPDGDVQDLTGLVNDNNYEFRSRLSVLFYFTQTAVGHAAVLQESSLQNRGPDQTASTTGKPSGSDQDVTDGTIAVVPEFGQTSSGGGSDELAGEVTGYFTEAEIKEEETDK